MIGWTTKHDCLTRCNIFFGGQCAVQKSLQIRKYLWDVKVGGGQNALDANLLRSFVPGRETSKHCQVQLRTYKYFAFQIILLIEQTQQLRGWRWACCPRSPPPPPPPPPWQDPSPPWTSRVMWRQFPDDQGFLTINDFMGQSLLGEAYHDSSWLHNCWWME